MTLFASLAETSERVCASAGRLAKIRELAALLSQVSAGEIGLAVHYLSGELPQGRIGVGPAAVTRAAATGPAPAPTLSVEAVDERLRTFAEIRGAGSAAQRAERLQELFALGTAAAMLGGAAALGRFQLELFVPVAPMLAQTAPDVSAALHDLGGEAAFEWKMDGARIQLHKAGDEVRIYTRGLRDVTAALPEIVELARMLSSGVLILDGEVIALDAAGRPHPFQITMRRVGRRLDVEAVREGLPLKAFFFDCLRLEAAGIADRPARERFAALAQAVPASAQMPRLVTSAADAAREYYEAALAAGHEGVMAKSLDAPYEAGNRGAGWLKIKRAHTLDLIVLAAEWGHGRRSGKLSNLHLGALDPASGRYVMLGKTFKGLTDAMLEWQTREFLERETHRDRVAVYLRPELVVEVAFSDLQASSRYPGGLALRLARVKRYRDDKSAAEADTMETVRRIYAAQSATAPR